MVVQSSGAFPGLVVSSTTLVYMGATPFFGKKVKGTSRSEHDVHVIRVECTSTYAYSLCSRVSTSTVGRGVLSCVPPRSASTGMAGCATGAAAMCQSSGDLIRLVRLLMRCF